MSGAIVQSADVAGRAVVEDRADVVVVGTGAAGATAARVLAETGLDVVMIEEGPHVTTEQFTPDAWGSFKHLWRDAGFQAARGRVFLPVLQGRAVGGTTVVNGAIIHRLPEPIHAAWLRDGHIDDLLAYARLERVCGRLDEELSVAPTPDAVLGGNNTLMRAGLVSLGVRHNPIARNVKECQGSARCLQGCPTGRKQSMALTYVPYAVARGARVYATCEAERVEMRGDRAIAVRGRFRDPSSRAAGPALRVSARRAVIVAASAIQTPLLLRASGVPDASGRLGRRLQAHPGTSVLGLFDDPVRIWSGATQGYESTHWWDERMKFESVGVSLDVGLARLHGFGRELMEQIADWSHLAQWGVQVRAEGMGSVRRGLLGGTAIRYDFAPADIPRYKLGITRLVRMMFAAGARAVFPGVYGMPPRLECADGIEAIDALPDDPRRFHFIAAHLFGTAVMHPDSSRGVVDPEGRVHGTRGLYVTDSSVFPTNLGVNPQHAICGVSWLLAERLAERAFAERRAVRPR